MLVGRGRRARSRARSAQPAFDDFLAHKVDASELDKRTMAAREKAAAEHKPLATLDQAFAAYTEAVAARARAQAGEDAAEAKLEAALRDLEKGSGAEKFLLKAESGSSG